MNVIYAFGSIFSRHPAILNRERNGMTTTALGNSFARKAATELDQIVVEELVENEIPSYIIASILLRFYENSMNFYQKKNSSFGKLRYFYQFLKFVILHFFYVLVS